VPEGVPTKVLEGQGPSRKDQDKANTRLAGIIEEGSGCGRLNSTDARFEILSFEAQLLIFWSLRLGFGFWLTVHLPEAKSHEPH
jgi:hypothetical protein